MTHHHGPRQNLLLAALPAAEYARLLPDLEHIAMPLGWVVYEAGSLQHHVYFPATCIVSMLYEMANGASTEIGITGREGMVGIALFMGGEDTHGRAVVQSAGDGYRMRSAALKREFALGGPLQYLALRYTQALITQIAQTAVCNRHHTLEQQLCRWLLLCLDRLPGNEITMTQSLLADMLGVRREGVTTAAGRLQEATVIRYSRGKIVVTDRGGLERRACECYRVVKAESDRLLPRQPARKPAAAAG